MGSCGRMACSGDRGGFCYKPGKETAERRQTIAPIKASEELYQKYNQIIGKLVNMIIKPNPWLLKRGVR